MKRPFTGIALLALLACGIAASAVTSTGFDFPIGNVNADGWLHGGVWGWEYLEWNGSVYHPGEDLNKNTGGNTDLGEAVYAVSEGTVVAAGDYGGSWGNVIVIRHSLPDGSTVWSQYAHLQRIDRSSGDVGRREQIGTVGNNGGMYSAHLHFEVRWSDLSASHWPSGKTQSWVGSSYAHPTDFINARRSLVIAPGDPSMGGPGNGAWYPPGTDITLYAHNNGGTSPETRIWVDGGPDWGWGDYEGQHWGVPGSGTYTWHGQKRNAAGYSNTVTWSFHINYPPNSPSLASPADGAILASRTIPLCWNGASDPDGGPGAVRYCVNRNDWGGETGWFGTGTSTSLTAPSDGTFTWQVKAADDWNESGYSGTRSFTVDTVAPSVSTAIVPARPDGNAGWYVTKPSFRISATDVTTRVAHTWYVLDGAGPASYSSPVLLSDGIHAYSGRADDDAANAGVSTTSTAKVDTLAPVVSVIASPAAPNGDSGWYTVRPIVTVSAVDPNGADASGVQDLFYSIDGFEQPYTGTFSVSEGVRAVVGRATDIAGNSGSAACEIKVDTTAPVFASVDAEPESNSLDVLTASWQCADPESGVANYEYSIYHKTGATDELIAGPVTTDESYGYLTSLGLVRGEVYCFVIRARNEAGLYSDLVASCDIAATDGTADVAPGMNSGGVSVPAEGRTSESYLVVDSFGQFVVDTSTSANFVVESGYWHSQTPTINTPSISLAKGVEDGKLIQLGSPTAPVVVTVAPSTFADRFYVEQPDRSSGIAVQFGAGLSMALAPGDRVWILGTTNTVDGERIVQYAAPTWVSHDLPLGVLSICSKWLGGSDFNALTKGADGAFGLNNIGVLVKTCGRIRQVDPSGAYFYIDDGSGLVDGTTTGGEDNIGVRIAADGRSYTPGGFVTVTGISSCFVESAKVLRMVRPTDILPM